MMSTWDFSNRILKLLRSVSNYKRLKIEKLKKVDCTISRRHNDEFKSVLKCLMA